MKKSTKVIRLSVTLLLLIAMLLTPMSPIFAVIIDGSGGADLTAADIVSEDASKREQFSRHFLTGDGTYFAVSYAEQVNYQDEDGNWIAVDNSLSTNVLTGEKTTRNDRFKVKFANKANKDDLVTIKTKEYDVSFGITVSEDGENYLALNKVKGTESASNTSAEPKTTQEATSLGKAVSGITYFDAFSDYLDVRYSVAHEKVKEDIILERKSGFNSYKVTYNIKEKDALATLNDDGSITFTSPGGAVLFTVGVPVMYDSEGIASSDIAVSMSQDKKTVEVTYTPSADWLNAEDRVYPVTIDPAFTTSDCFYETLLCYSSEPYEIWLNSTVNTATIYQDQSYYLWLNAPSLPSSVNVSGVDFVLTVTDYCLDDAILVERVDSFWAPGEMDYNTIGELDSFSVGVYENCLYYDSDAYRITLNIPNDNISEAGGYSNYFGNNYYGHRFTGIDSTFLDIYVSGYSEPSYRPCMIVRYGGNSVSDITSGKLYHIKNVTANSYLTVNSDTDAIAANTTLSLDSLDSNNSMQVFKINFETAEGAYRIRPYTASLSSEDSMYLNYNTSTYAANISNTLKYWMITSRSDGYAIYDVANSVALSKSYGTNVGVAYYSDTDTYQSWTFELVENQYNVYTNRDICVYPGKTLYTIPNFAVTSWASSNTNAATVDQYGRITTIAPGKSLITTSNASCQITVNVLLTDGVYFFHNKEYSKPMQIDDDSSPTASGSFFELQDFDGESYQKWQITHVGIGYYKITSAASQLAATAPNSKNGKITQTSYTGATTQQWTIDYTGEAYKLSPRSNPNYYLAVGSGVDVSMGVIDTINGRNIEMRDEQDDGKDEWAIKSVSEYIHLTLPIRIYYDASCELSETEIIAQFEEANTYFKEQYYIEFSFESIEYSSLLNHDSNNCSGGYNGCYTSCGEVVYCNTQHHKSAGRLLGLLHSDDYYTLRVVGYGLCLYYDGSHDPVLGAGTLGQVDTIVTTIYGNIAKCIQHELSHNLGTTDCENSCCFMENNTVSEYCDECKKAIKNNYSHGG